MSTSSENIISNSSYTEKDFQVIYPALLDLTQKLTAKWDPSASNESDPGVLLLKLNALIADKCNYNMDKNVLECFPLSVTQDVNAKQLFEQLGYYMHWYKGAETVVTLKYIVSNISEDAYTGEDDEETVEAGDLTYTIPRFTMVCDEKTSVVYTLVDEKTLKNDGATQSFNAVQGVAVQYDINGDTTITASDLDSNRRIYFTDTKIAENGIFINNVNVDNYSSWEKKDNLLLEELSSSNTYYKFGVSQDLSTCYLEFPENVEELFQDGINITYIRTDGEDGNVAAYTLENFYQDITVKVKNKNSTSSEEEETVLTSDDISIKNYFVGSGGESPETINDAYINYKKTIGTFETLVTLRDYMNSVSKSQYVSNALVCDRTTDPQSSYDIITESGSVNQPINEVETTTAYDVDGYLYQNDFYTDSDHKYQVDPDTDKNYYDNHTEQSYRVIYNTVDGVTTHTYIQADAVEKYALSAFDIKLYLLSAVGLVNSATAYNTTFRLNRDSTIDAAVLSELEEKKLIQHEAVDILEDKICFIKNKYPINCTIIPQYAVTSAQAEEITKNVRLALYENLNSSKLTFGEEISYDTIYNIILDADSRIKAIALDRLTYTTYAVYIDSDDHQLKEVELTDYTTYYQSTYKMKDTLSGSNLGAFETGVNVMSGDGSTYATADGIKLEASTSSFSAYLLNYEVVSSSEEVVTVTIPKCRMRGDITGDGKWTSSDSDLLLQYLAGWAIEFDDIQKWCCQTYNSTFKTLDSHDGVELLKLVQGSFDTIVKPERIVDYYNNWTFNTSTAKWTASINISAESSSGLVYFDNIKIGSYKNGVATVSFSYPPTEDTLYDLTLKPNDTSELMKSSSVPKANADGWTRIYKSGSGWITGIPHNLKFKENIIRKYLALYGWASTNADDIVYEDSDIDVDTDLASNFMIDIYSKSVLAGKTQFFVKDTEFDYGINQKYQLLERSIGRFDSEVDITFQKDAGSELEPWTYQVRENETVQLLAPNLIESKSYGTNIRFEYYIPLPEGVESETIAANSSYKLKEGEYFAFYWSESTETNSGYEYAVYGAGAIIQPSFSIEKNATSKELICVTYGLKDQLYTVTVNNSKYLYKDGNSSSEVKADELTAAIKKLVKTENVLSSNREVNIMLINSIVLSKTSDYCYWILNEIENDKYYLFKVTDGPTRILKSGEYFIYTTSGGADMHILGAGTKIYKPYTITSNLYVDAISYSDVIEQGAIALSSYWYALSGIELDITEMQYKIFGEGMLINIKPNSGEDEITIGTESETSLSGYTIKYKETINDSWVAVPSIVIGDDTEDNDWVARTSLRIDSSSSTAQHLQSGQKIYYYYYNSVLDTVSEEPDGHIDPTEAVWGGEAYLFTSRLINNVGGVNISTLEQDENDENQPIDIYAYIYGEMSDDVKILSNGSTQVLFKEDTTTVVVSGQSVPVSTTTREKDEFTVTVDKSAFISKVGEYLYNTYDFIYSNNAWYLNSSTITLSDYGLEVVAPYGLATGDEIIVIYTGPEKWEQTQTKEVVFRLPRGNYIMPVYHDTDSDLIDKVFLYLDRNNYAEYSTTRLYQLNDIVNSTNGEDVTHYQYINAVATIGTPLSNTDYWKAVPGELLYPMGLSDADKLEKNANLYVAGNYYLRVDDLPEGEPGSFFVKVFVQVHYIKDYASGDVPVVSIVIPPIFKYSDSSALSKEVNLNAKLFTRINTHIRELDYHNLFDYTYVVDEDEEIANPLKSESYLNSNHVFNHCTIPQMDTADAEIYITNKIKG